MSRPQTDSAGAAKVNVVAGIVLAITSLAALFWLIPSHISAETTPGDLPPNTLPYLAAGLILLFSLGLILQARLNGPGRDVELSGADILMELLVSVFVIAAVVFVYDRFGFLAMAIPLTAGAMVYAGGRNWLGIGMASIALPVLLKFGVWHIFTVSLP